MPRKLEITGVRKQLCAAALFCCAAVHGADFVWTNTSGGTWSAAANWNLNQVPTSNDTAWITNNGNYSVTNNATSGAATLILGGTSGVQTLNHTAGTFSLGTGGSSSPNGTYILGGGTLTGSGTLALGGPLNWTAGTIGSATSNLVVVANGGLTISGAGAKTLNGGMLINDSAASWTGSSIAFNNTSILSNAPSATFDLQADGTIFGLNTGTPLVVNSGTFRKTAGTGVSTVTTPFNNSGLVDIQTGALSLNGGGNSAGQFMCSSNVAGLRFGGGTHALQDSSSISGAGNVSVLSGTVNLQSAVAIGAWTNSGGNLNINTFTTVYVTNFTVAGATMNASNTIVVPGIFAWTGGTIGSAGSIMTLLANGGITLNGSSKNFNGGTIINNSNAVWTAGQINCNSTAIFSNTPAAIFDFQADGAGPALNSGAPFFANSGTIRKSAGTGTSTISVACNNSGLVQVQTGTLSFTGGGSNSGQYMTTNGSVISFNGGTHLLQSGSSVSGPGAVSVGTGIVNVQGAFNVNWLTNSGTLNFNEFVTVYPTNVALSGGTLTGSNTVAIGGLFAWSSGTLGPGSGFTVAANGSMTIATGGTKTLQGGTLINNGTGAWLGGQVTCNNTPIFSNAPGATFELQADGTSFILNFGVPVFANAGTFRKSAGTGTTTFTMPCANTGTVEINTGTLALSLTDGTGTFSVASGATFNASGTGTLAPAASISGAGNFAFTSGALTNHGTFTVSGTNTFTSGTVRLDGTCTINATPVIINGGNVVFAGSGTLAPSSVIFSSGTLQGSMTMTVSGPFSWTGGNFGVSGSTIIVFANGGSTLSGTTKTFNGGTLVNGGPGAWTVGQVVCNNACLFSNAPSGTFDLQGGGSSFAFNSGTPQFANAGLLLKSGSGTNTVTVPCANAGTVQVSSGGLALTLKDSTGSFTAAAGTTLSVNGTATLAPSTSISGAGNFEFTAGSLTNHGTMNVSGSHSFLAGTPRFDGIVMVTNAPVTISGGTVIFSGSGTVAPSALNVSSGVLQGTMPVTVVGPMLWTGGTLASAASVSANGGLALSSLNTKILSCTLVNNGGATWTNGQVACNSATFSNSASAVLDVLGDGTPFAQNSGISLLANDGTFRKKNGPATATSSIPFSNRGTVEVNSGTLAFGAYTQTAGQTLLNGGNFSFSQTAQFRGGSLNGNGTVTGSISNNATVSPGASPGLMTITGNYTEGSGSHLQIELGGTTAGVTHDQLSVGGTAKLAGTLDISYFNGFVPTPGNVFTALVCNARSGGFSVVQAPTNTLSTVYTAKSVLIEPGNVSPTASLAVSQLQQIACHTFLIQASGADADGTVTNLSLFQDTNLLASVSGGSAQVSYSTDFPGDLALTAIATDNKGASGVTNVTVSITTLPLLTLDAVGFQTNRAFKLCMAGETGTNYEIQMKTNLSRTNWTVLGMMQSTNGIWRFSDVTASNSTSRVYRARQLP